MIEELTTAVFANPAPQWKEFFGESSLRLSEAKRGEKYFNQSCVRCHGTYEKAWALSPDAFRALQKNRANLRVFDTVKVTYFETTPTTDVGTDPNRNQGMQAMVEGLNPLRFSKNHGISIETQVGYVPPPLDGIWARYPYLHNNSVPSLCALMTPPEKRPVHYYAGEAIDPNRDYDQRCVGYPSGTAVPHEWKQNPDYEFNTQKQGLSNQGHYSKMFLRHGKEIFTPEQKMDLIEYLKTL